MDEERSEKEGSSIVTLSVAMLCALGGLLWLVASVFFLICSELTTGRVIDNPNLEERSLLYEFADKAGVLQTGRCLLSSEREIGDEVSLRYMNGLSHWNSEDSLPAILGGPAVLMGIGFLVVAFLKIYDRLRGR